MKSYLHVKCFFFQISILACIEKGFQRNRVYEVCFYSKYLSWSVSNRAFIEIFMLEYIKCGFSQNIYPRMYYIRFS